MLHLLRLLPVVEFLPSRAPLTDDEAADLIPRYIERQTTGSASRAVKAKAKARADIEATRTKTIATANPKGEFLVGRMCDPNCLGWSPSASNHGLLIERCDECARARGIADDYLDDDAERTAAAWLRAVLAGCASPDPHDVGNVCEALWSSETGRAALALHF